jgi:CTP:molybdopterin cytidylyltransferase MocA
MTEHKFGLILLAAGKSTRFEDNKLLSKIKNKFMIDHSLDTFLSMDTLINPIIVVVGGYKEQMQKHLQNKKLVVAYNQKFETGGMISSIHTGLNELGKLNSVIDGIFIHPADVPFVKTDDVRKMIELMLDGRHQIVVPLYKNQRGHPVLVNNKLINELEYLEEESHGLRGFLDKYENNMGYMITENSGVRSDIDYKSDIPNDEK